MKEILWAKLIERILYGLSNQLKKAVIHFALLPSSLLYFSSDRLTLSVFLHRELTTGVKMYKLLAFAAVLAAGMYAITEI